jgi:hypothetical protein
VSTGFVWLSIETFRWQHCASQSGVFRTWFWYCNTDNFSTIWTEQLPITTDNIIPVLPNTVLFLCGQGADFRPRQTSGVLLFWWRQWPESLRRVPTVKTARPLRLCCFFYQGYLFMLYGIHINHSVVSCASRSGFVSTIWKLFDMYL